MSVEIERKFLVVSDEWRQHVVKRRSVRQAYLARGRNTSLRVRIVDDRVASIAIKSTGAHLTRQEFEYSVSRDDAEALMAMNEGGVVRKIRHDVPFGGLVWEVDVFDDAHEGLIIAEVELAHENQVVHLPNWVGREVTRDKRYSNSRLAKVSLEVQRELMESASR